MSDIVLGFLAVVAYIGPPILLIYFIASLYDGISGEFAKTQAVKVSRRSVTNDSREDSIEMVRPNADVYDAFNIDDDHDKQVFMEDDGALILISRGVTFKALNASTSLFVIASTGSAVRDMNSETEADADE